MINEIILNIFEGIRSITNNNDNTKVLITYDRDRSSTCSILNIIKNYINKYKSSYVLYLFNICSYHYKIRLLRLLLRY